MNATTMKKKTVYLFVFDGFADWEAAYALVGINLSKAFTIKTIAIDKTHKKSMGGVSIFPDLDFLPETDLCDIDQSNTAMLILPGGSAWEQKTNQSIAPLVLHCAEHGIPVAAICGATVFLADLGLLDAIDPQLPHVGCAAICQSQQRICARSSVQAIGAVGTDRRSRG